jgi:hypothetical protein
VRRGARNIVLGSLAAIGCEFDVGVEFVELIFELLLEIAIFPHPAPLPLFAHARVCIVVVVDEPLEIAQVVAACHGDERRAQMREDRGVRAPERDRCFDRIDDVEDVRVRRAVDEKPSCARRYRWSSTASR